MLAATGVGPCSTVPYALRAYGGHERCNLKTLQNATVDRIWRRSTCCVHFVAVSHSSLPPLCLVAVPPVPVAQRLLLRPDQGGAGGGAARPLPPAHAAAAGGRGGVRAPTSGAQDKKEAGLATVYVGRDVKRRVRRHGGHGCWCEGGARCTGHGSGGCGEVVANLCAAHI